MAPASQTFKNVEAHFFVFNHRNKDTDEKS